MFSLLQIHLNMTELVEKTEKTRKRLNELSVAIDPELSREVLNEWIFCLNSILYRLHCETARLMPAKDSREVTHQIENGKSVVDVLPSENNTHFEASKDINREDIDRFKKDLDYNVAKSSSNGSLSQNIRQIDWKNLCHTKDPFHLSIPDHSRASELAMYCLDLCCYGDICKFVNPASTETSKHSKHGNFSHSVTGVAMPTPNCDHSVDAGNSTESIQSDQHMPYVSSMQENYETCTVSEFDKSSQDHCHSKELDTFVQCHYHLLNVKRIRQTLYTSNDPSYTLWCALLKCAQGECQLCVILVQHIT